MRESLKKILEQVRGGIKRLANDRDVRNAAIGAGIGGLTLGGVHYLSDKDPEDSKYAPLGSALLGAVLGGTAGYAIPKAIRTMRGDGASAGASSATAPKPKPKPVPVAPKAKPTNVGASAREYVEDAAISGGTGAALGGASLIPSEIATRKLKHSNSVAQQKVDAVRHAGTSKGNAAAAALNKNLAAATDDAAAAAKSLANAMPGTDARTIAQVDLLAANARKALYGNNTASDMNQIITETYNLYTDAVNRGDKTAARAYQYLLKKEFPSLHTFYRRGFNVHSELDYGPISLIDDAMLRPPTGQLNKQTGIIEKTKDPLTSKLYRYIVNRFKGERFAPKEYKNLLPVGPRVIRISPNARRIKRVGKWAAVPVVGSVLLNYLLGNGEAQPGKE